MVYVVVVSFFLSSPSASIPPGGMTASFYANKKAPSYTGIGYMGA